MFNVKSNSRHCIAYTHGQRYHCSCYSAYPILPNDEAKLPYTFPRQFIPLLFQLPGFHSVLDLYINQIYMVAKIRRLKHHIMKSTSQKDSCPRNDSLFILPMIFQTSFSTPCKIILFCTKTNDYEFPGENYMTILDKVDKFR